MVARDGVTDVILFPCGMNDLELTVKVHHQVCSSQDNGVEVRGGTQGAEKIDSVGVICVNNNTARGRAHEM